MIDAYTAVEDIDYEGSPSCEVQEEIAVSSDDEAAMDDIPLESEPAIERLTSIQSLG